MVWARRVGMQGMITDVVTTLDEVERFAALAYAAGQESERQRMRDAAPASVAESLDAIEAAIRAKGAP